MKRLPPQCEGDALSTLRRNVSWAGLDVSTPNKRDMNCIRELAGQDWEGPNIRNGNRSKEESGSTR